jgi:hypothetical protein
MTQVVRVLMGNKKPMEYTFTKTVEQKFNLLPNAEPIDYFSLFFNYVLLNNTIAKTKKLQNFGYDRNSFAISGLLSVLLK